MNTRAALPQLGDKILVVVENAPQFLDELHSVILSLPVLSDTFFTLMCCCPQQYWEHGGADNPEVLQEIQMAWQEELAASLRAEHYLEQARTMLESAGVPAPNIVTVIAAEEDNLLDATMHELTKSHVQYSGVIVSQFHDEIVNRLLKRGITDVFRHIPNVEVLTLHLD